MSKFIRFLKDKFNFPSLVRQVVFSWLIAVAIEYFILPRELRDLSRLDGLAQMSLLRVILITVSCTLLLFTVSCFRNISKFERWGIVGVFALIALGSLGVSITKEYLLVCILIMVALLVFGWIGWNNSDELKLKEKKNIYLWITIWATAAFFLFVSAWTVGRVYSFSSPTFDFGIFSQMFYNMKESGLPLTTVERDGLLSHFAVHVSPIYYLMLPFYWIFPSPATLQVLQALVITSAVIPLWKIAKHHGLTEIQRMLICILLLLYPAFSGGVSYDIHENCFLTPLILWTLYGIDKKNSIMISISAILTLMVKEDAAVYVAVIALWLIIKTLLNFKDLNKKDLVTGVLMLVISISWFFIVTTYLSRNGDGVMTYRYNNFMYDGSSSLITVIKSIILNPMKAIYECVDPEKLKFIGLTLLTLLGLPLITRRYERYILLIPYLLVNLMSDYQYQHDVFFQYTFGSIAFLFYLTVINLADLKVNIKRVSALILATVISAACFYTVIFPVGIKYPIKAVDYYDYYENIRETLDTIPEDASVTTTTFYTTYLSQREVLYDVKYCSKEHLLETEYIVLKVDSNSECKKYATDGETNGFNNLINLLDDNGYRKYGEVDNVLVIYCKEK